MYGIHHGIFKARKNPDSDSIYSWSMAGVVAHRAAKETSDWFDEHMDELFETISDSGE